MARKKESEQQVEFVIEDEEESADGNEVRSGQIERFEVRIGTPSVTGGRMVKPERAPEAGPAAGQSGGPQTVSGQPQMKQSPQGQQNAVQGASVQQIFKIEDDLRKTKELVDDLRHTVGIMEGELKDLRAEVERMSYLLKSLEGLKNAMKDMESTVSELSGLYDLISANVNPFVDVPSLHVNERTSSQKGRPTPPSMSGFKDVSEIFGEEGKERAASSADLFSEEWTLRWVQFLIERVGKEGLEKALYYYHDLKWIDEGLITKALEMAKGTAAPKLPEGKRIAWKLEADDHLKSLEFVRRIKGMDNLR